MNAKVYFDIANFTFEHKNTICVINDGSTNNGTSGKEVVTISNNENVRNQYCSGKLINEYGRSIQNYNKNSVFGYCEFDIFKIDYTTRESGLVSSGDFYQGYISEFNLRAVYIETLITFLWFIKDNSIGINGTYGQIPDYKIVNGKSRSIVNYNCTGGISDTTFSPQEIIKASEIVSKYGSICGLSRKINDDTNMLWQYDENGQILKAIIPKTSQSFAYDAQKALDRALHFLVIARGQNYPMYRIAYYMPIFECLFNNFGSEITFRIAQRAAFYIGVDPEERINIFNSITEGYNLRSKLFHGSEIKDKNLLSRDKLTTLSIKLDEWLRRILTKAIKYDSEVFNDYPTKLKNDFFDNPILGLEVNRDDLKSNFDERRKQAEETKNRNGSKKQREKVLKEKK